MEKTATNSLDEIPILLEGVYSEIKDIEMDMETQNSLLTTQNEKKSGMIVQMLDRMRQGEQLSDSILDYCYYHYGSYYRCPYSEQ